MDVPKIEQHTDVSRETSAQVKIDFVLRRYRAMALRTEPDHAILMQAHWVNGIRAQDSCRDWSRHAN
ncbi:MAG: hypothetical protein ABSG46_12985, partial [Candidatus Binataceae bacterium]